MDHISVVVDFGRIAIVKARARRRVNLRTFKVRILVGCLLNTVYPGVGKNAFLEGFSRCYANPSATRTRIRVCMSVV